MSRKTKQHRQYNVTPQVFDKMLLTSYEPQASRGLIPNQFEPHGYIYGKNNYYKACGEYPVEEYDMQHNSVFGRDNTEYVHCSGYFIIKRQDMVVLNKLPFGVRDLQILCPDSEGYFDAINYYNKVFSFRGKDAILQVEVDDFVKKSQTDDGFYFFRFNNRKGVFVEVEYSFESKGFVEVE